MHRGRGLLFAGAALLSSISFAPPGAVAQAAPAAAQPEAALPVFEVASIRPSPSDVQQAMLFFNPNGITITGFPLGKIVLEGFHVQEDQLVGMPGWAKSARFDIEAKVPAEDAPRLKGLKIEQRGAMIVRLLEDRFNLKYHRETRELGIYSLVVARGGPRLQAAPSASADGARRSTYSMFKGPGELESVGTGMPVLARQLSQTVGHIVVDKTGLTGSYDYTLRWTPEDTAHAQEASASAETAGSGASLYTALEEQLGLKLESNKGPAEVIVIDRLDMPSAN